MGKSKESDGSNLFDNTAITFGKWHLGDDDEYVLFARRFGEVAVMDADRLFAQG